MIAVIGDIHGCFFTLKELYSKIIDLYPEIEIYQVGDIIDRGPYSREAISFIIENSIRSVLGNHEQMALEFLKNKESSLGRAWLYNGYMPTLLSYKNYQDDFNNHFEFLSKLPLFYNLSDCFISHAGISKTYQNRFKEVLLNDEDQLKKIIDNLKRKDDGILWTRDRLANLGKLQVVGHTRMIEPYFDKEANALFIDTGAIGGNKLSCAIIEKSSIIEIISVETKEEDLNYEVIFNKINNEKEDNASEKKDIN